MRILVAAFAGLLFAGTPALAQDAGEAAQQPAVIGPPQLQNFSLNGTITREAPAPTQVLPAERQEPQRRPPAQSTQSQRKQAIASPPAQPSREPREPEVVARPNRPAAETSPFQADASSISEAAGSSAPLENASTAAAGAVANSAGGVSVLPWLLASIFLGGAAAWFFLRQRPRASYAGAGEIDSFEAPPVPAAPVPAAPRTAPEAPEPAQGTSAGVVSTRLRPWLEIEFKPLRAVVDEQRAAVAFELAVFNSGKVPAREVLLQASLFNAGPAQDQQIKLFFDNPVARGDRIPVIPPLQRVSVETAVFLQRDQVRPIELEGRSLFVPLIGFNALYSWGRGEGQTSASFLVGKQTGGEKLAPLRLDLGSRIFRNLAAREHELRRRD